MAIETKEYAQLAAYVYAVKKHRVRSCLLPFIQLSHPKSARIKQEHAILNSLKVNKYAGYRLKYTFFRPCFMANSVVAHRIAPSDI